jgi:twinfilin-like protein
VAAPEALLSEWASWQDPASKIRLGVFDIDVDSLVFSIRSSSSGTDNFQDDFKLVHKHLKPDVPALIALRGDPKWILIAWIPDEAQVKKKMIFSSSRAALKSQLGATKFDHDLQVSSASECTYANYVLGFDEQEKEKTLSSVEKLTHEENKDVSTQMALQTEGMKMLNINVDDAAIKAFSAIKNNPEKCAAFFYVNDTGDQLTADPATTNYTIQSLASKLDPDRPCYVVFHYAHINSETEEAQNKTLIVYFCSDDAAPKKKMISATVFKNIGAACAALGIEVAKKVEISLVAECSDAEFLTSLYPPVVIKEQFSRPKGPPRKKR